MDVKDETKGTSETPKIPDSIGSEQEFIITFKTDNNGLIKVPLDYFLKLSPLRIH